jgi:succinyl-CoA synthetase alpha subunit
MTEHTPNDQFHARPLMCQTEIDGGRLYATQGRSNAESKIEAMKRAGIVVADSPAGLGEAVMKAIKG